LSLNKEAAKLTFMQQLDAVLSQVEPMQNQWYTVLETTKDCRVYAVTVLVWTANETLEVRITVDGKVLTGAVGATQTTYYYVHHQLYGSGLTIDGNMFLLGKYTPLEGRSIKVEVRKTTATGSGTLEARVIYAKR
jgi:hypothetical protein